MPYSLSNWTPAFIRHGWNHEPPVHETESTFWKHAKQVLKGGSLLLAGTLGYSWVKTSWSWNNKMGDNGLISLADRNLPLSNINYAPLVDSSDKSADLNIYYQSKSSTTRINVDANQARSFAQRDLAKRVALGSEFQINNYTLNDQISPKLALLNNGNFIAIWSSQGQDGSRHGAFGQILDAAGSKVGNEIQINQYTILDQDAAGATSLSNGNIAIVWGSFGQDGSGRGVYGRLFTVDGNRIGNETQINTDAAGDQFATGITALDNSGFAVIWDNYNYAANATNVYCQVLDSAGNKPTAVFQVNANGNGGHNYSVLTKLSNNTLAVAWRNNNGTDTSGFGVYGRLIDISGNRIGNEIQINTYTNADQLDPVLTTLSNNNFVAVWTSYGQDGLNTSIRGQLFTGAFNRIGSEFLIHLPISYNQSFPAIINLPNDNFAAAWQSYGQDGSGWGIFGQIFDPLANKVGNEFQINDVSLGSQTTPYLISYPNGNIVAAWESDGQDGSGKGIFAKILATQLSATNLNQVVNYLKNTNYDFKDIVITLPAYVSNVTATLTLSDSFTGQLTTGTSGATTATYNSTTGIWQAAGTVDEVNALLANLQFIPAVNSQRNANLNVIVDDGIDAPLTSTISIIGDEFLVNEYRTNFQENARIAVLKNGNFVITWDGYGVQDNDRAGIYAQLYSPTGVRMGSNFLVNNNTAADQARPAIASLANGGFVILFQGWYQDGNNNGIAGRIYDAQGVPISQEFVVNNHTIGDQINVAVAALANNNFVATWQSYGQDDSDYGIYGQMFNATAGKIGNEFQINNSTSLDQITPYIAKLANNNYAVAWISNNLDWNVYCQLFDQAGTKINSEFRVNNEVSGAQALPRIAGLSDGNFVVTWDSNYGPNDSGVGVYGQLFNATGARIGTDFLVNSFTALNQGNNYVTAMANSNFAVIWASANQDGSGLGIYSQLFNGAGAKIGKEFRVNSYIIGDQFEPAIAALNNGNLITTWQSYGQDGSDWGIYGKIIDTHLYAVNTNQTIIYTENTSYKLVAIAIKPAIFIENISANLQLSNSTAGRLTTGTSNNVTSIFNPTQGLWQAFGAANDVNNLLANITFQPTQYFNGNFTIKVSIDDGFNTPLNDTIAVQGIAVNQPPVLQNNQLTIGQGQRVILSSSHLSATDVDNDNAVLIFTVNIVRHGQFEFVDDPDTIINSFTQQQIQEGKVIFKQDGSSEMPAYRVSVSDGQLSTAYISANVTFIPTKSLASDSGYITATQYTSSPKGPDNTAVIAGSVGGVVGLAAVATAIGFFVAYKNKKLCFKETVPIDLKIEMSETKEAPNLTSR